MADSLSDTTAHDKVWLARQAEVPHYNRSSTSTTVSPLTTENALRAVTGAGVVALRLRRKPRRELQVVLTPRGAKVVADFAAFRHQELARVVQRMPPPQCRALQGAFAAFTAVGDPPAPQFTLGG
jgi:hypothetical protein